MADEADTQDTQETEQAQPQPDATGTPSEKLLPQSEVNALIAREKDKLRRSLNEQYKGEREKLEQEWSGKYRGALDRAALAPHVKPEALDDALAALSDDFRGEDGSLDAGRFLEAKPWFGQERSKAIKNLNASAPDKPDMDSLIRRAARRG